MTTAGELLYDNLLRWQKEFQLTRQKFDELQGLKRGTVSVGMVQALAEGALPVRWPILLAGNPGWSWCYRSRIAIPSARKCGRRISILA
jgi:DNA-binding transcriptional LysR family regulator